LGIVVPTAELAVLAKTGIDVIEKASPPFVTEQTDRHILLEICPSRGFRLKKTWVELYNRKWFVDILYLSVD
jgi:hypothetical protein